MLRMQPALRGYASPLTQAMVRLYLASQERFTQDMQPHYVYSPREMTRWVRGICEAIRSVGSYSFSCNDVVKMELFPCCRNVYYGSATLHVVVP